MKTFKQNKRLARREQRLKAAKPAKYKQRMSMSEWMNRQQELSDQRSALRAYEQVLRDQNRYAEIQKKAGLPDQERKTNPSGGI